MLLTAVIWGFAFVAQRVGMEHVGPFTFNALRFTLGAIVLIPVILLRHRNVLLRAKRSNLGIPPTTANPMFTAALLSGLALFGGITFQQIGIIYTTAGKAGFITGWYVILVPISGALWGQKIGINSWLGAILATTGLYLLTIAGLFAINRGDGLVLICALFWTVHVHLIGYYSPRVDTIKLAFLQFAICSILSLIIALIIETNSLSSILKAALPILYAGCLSVGIAYTLQVVAQRHVPSSHAAIILSLEAVFAVIGGWLLLNEVLSIIATVGCIFMLSGMLLSQIQKYSPLLSAGGKRRGVK